MRRRSTALRCWPSSGSTARRWRSSRPAGVAGSRSSTARSRRSGSTGQRRGPGWRPRRVPGRSYPGPSAALRPTLTAPLQYARLQSAFESKEPRPQDLSRMLDLETKARIADVPPPRQPPGLLHPSPSRLSDLQILVLKEEIRSYQDKLREIQAEMLLRCATRRSGPIGAKQSLPVPDSRFTLCVVAGRTPTTARSPGASGRPCRSGSPRTPRTRCATGCPTRPRPRPGACCGPQRLHLASRAMPACPRA